MALPNMFEHNMIELASDYTQSLVLTNDQLKNLMKELVNEFEKGLEDEEHATVKMLLTYVRDLPRRDEKGRYMALDLGGTNFRVLMIGLNGHTANVASVIYEIPDELRTCSGEELFDHIAICIIDFVSKNQLDNLPLPLGFTFSFPCVQRGIDHAQLVTWTKGFNCPGVVGKDVILLLKNALKRKTGHTDSIVHIVAAINDTTGTLMSCAHRNRECRVGLIVGTGCNACYMETLERVKKWKENITDPKQVIINTEWGAFGDNNTLKKLGITTQWDDQIDKESINQGKQTYEKLVSGMYLGEIVRYVLLSLIKTKILFNGIIPQNLLINNSFLTKFVSKIDTDIGTGEYSGVRHVFEKHFNVTQMNMTDLKIIQLVNSRVSQRAANLAAAGCATILNRMERVHTTIGYDGSVLRYHPHFRDWMNDKIAELTNPKYKYDLMLSGDGSGRGAALVAAVAYRQKINNN